MIEYRLIRSPRRTLSVQVNGQGALVVRAPLRMPAAGIEAFLLRRQEWIRIHQQRARRRETYELCDGARLPFGGGEVTVRLCGVPMGMDRDGFLLLPRENTLEEARKWRVKRAEELLTPRLAGWEEITGLHARHVSWTHARTRWGSMSACGDLRLNSALVHCPLPVCDYVMVHELAHLLHPDHSPAFHACVRAFLPGADALRSGLYDRAGLLSVFEAEKS